MYFVANQLHKDDEFKCVLITHHTCFEDFFHKIKIKMRPHRQGVHVAYVKYPHIVQRQRVLVEQPIPHQFVAFHLKIGVKGFCIFCYHSITQHSI